MTTARKKADPFTAEEVAALNKQLKPYEEALERVEDELRLKGKILGEALREQGSLSYFYGVRRAELVAISKRVDAKVQAIRGRLHRKIKEEDARASSEREIAKYVDAHDDYLTALDVHLLVEELYKKYSEVDVAFERRGFSLRDFVTAREKEFNSMVM